jgi:hypothetical protein
MPDGFELITEFPLGNALLGDRLQILRDGVWVDRIRCRDGLGCVDAAEVFACQGAGGLHGFRPGLYRVIRPLA